MVLKENITIYNDLLQEFVDYVNNGWEKNYTIQDIVGIELGKKFLFVHFNKNDFSKEAYPVNFTLSLQ
jgi:hypothetical protein